MIAEQHDPLLMTTREAQGYVAGDGIRIAFGYWPGRGTPLVALHGITASYVSFAGVAERLAGRRAVFALDLRGRGRSDKPSGPYGMAQHAADVASAMRAMNLGASIIVGHSMGGFVATALYKQAPELVAALVLIDGGYAPAMPGSGSQRSVNPALAQRLDQLRRTYPSREAYRGFWRAQPQFPPDVWNSWIEAYFDYEIEGEPPELRLRASEKGILADMNEGLDSERIIARCRGISVPVLMLRAPAGFVPGSAPLFPNQLIVEMRACIPQMEEHLVPGSTHYTIIMGVPGATVVADLIDKFAVRCSHGIEPRQETDSNNPQLALSGPSQNIGEHL